MVMNQFNLVSTKFESKIQVVDITILLDFLFERFVLLNIAAYSRMSHIERKILSHVQNRKLKLLEALSHVFSSF